MIEAKQLTYHYPNSKTNTVKNLNFSVGAGQIFGFLGPSGAGKSTTQAILTRQIPDGFHGSVMLLGKSLDQWGREIYNKIGVSFELPNHYLKLSALENLGLFSALYEQFTKPEHKSLELLKMVGLEDDKDRKVSEYSKGMKMRLNFVRSLLHDPEVLFLDEPTSGLDPLNARNIKNIILDLKSRGKTIFLTTHNMADADELCDEVAFLVDGEIKLIDSPQELKLRYGKKTVKIECINSIEPSKKPIVKRFKIKNLGNNKEFIDLLKTHEVRTIHTEEASLDQIFIETTGRKLQ